MTDCIGNDLREAIADVSQCSVETLHFGCSVLLLSLGLCCIVCYVLVRVFIQNDSRRLLVIVVRAPLVALGQ